MKDINEKNENRYINDDNIATQKDLKILRLEINNDMAILKSEIFGVFNNLKLDIEKRFNSVITKLGTLIVACSGILFGLLSYFHK